MPHLQDPKKPDGVWVTRVVLLGLHDHIRQFVKEDIKRTLLLQRSGKINLGKIAGKKVHSCNQIPNRTARVWALFKLSRKSTKDQGKKRPGEKETGGKKRPGEKETGGRTERVRRSLSICGYGIRCFILVHSTFRAKQAVKLGWLDRIYPSKW